MEINDQPVKLQYILENLKLTSEEIDEALVAAKRQVILLETLQSYIISKESKRKSTIRIESETAAKERLIAVLDHLKEHGPQRGADIRNALDIAVYSTLRLGISEGSIIKEGSLYVSTNVDSTNNNPE